MKKKKWPCILGILAALILQFTGIIFGPQSFRHTGGVCILAGAVLFSLCINRLYRLWYETHFPDMIHQEHIEYQDERNILLCSQSKAKSADIIQWMILGIACLVFFANGPLWITLILILTFVLHHGLEWYYLGKYQKEM